MINKPKKNIDLRQHNYIFNNILYSTYNFNNIEQSCFYLNYFGIKKEKRKDYNKKFKKNF